MAQFLCEAGRGVRGAKPPGYAGGFGKPLGPPRAGSPSNGGLEPEIRGGIGARNAGGHLGIISVRKAQTTPPSGLSEKLEPPPRDSGKQSFKILPPRASCQKSSSHPPEQNLRFYPPGIIMTSRVGIFDHAIYHANA